MVSLKPPANRQDQEAELSEPLPQTTDFEYSLVEPAP